MVMESWADMMAEHHEDWEDFIACTISKEDFYERFDAGFGSAAKKGKNFLAWSAERVYFPVTYDGSMSIASAPRNPTAEPLGEFIGGGYRAY